MALFAVVHGSMAGPTAYTRLAEELDHRGQRVLLVELPVDRPELTGTDYARLVAEQLDAAGHGSHREPVVVVAHSASGLLLPLVPAFRPVARSRTRMAATEAASGIFIMRSIAVGTKLGSIRGRPIPSIRDGIPVA